MARFRIEDADLDLKTSTLTALAQKLGVKVIELFEESKADNTDP